MKSLLLGFFIVLTAAPVFAQPAVKVYAYEQEVMPGNIPKGVTDENGNPVPDKSWIKTEYRIFFSHSKNYRIKPVLLFIKKKPFEIQSANSVVTPVEEMIIADGSSGSKKSLVAKTSNKVLSIVKGNEAAKKIYTPTLQKMIGANEVVVVYEWKGKKYYAGSKKLKKLEAQQHQ